MKQRGTATDKLADVIQMLQLVRKTGLLTVQRDGSTSELGTITFHNGQITDASVGQIRGTDAFTKLITWTACHFVFQSLSLTETPTPPAFQLSEQQRQNGAQPAHIPYHILQPRDVLPSFNNSGLSRLHRQLLLLIDGKRSVYDLTRLIGRRPDEVLAMLADLENANLIHF